MVFAKRADAKYRRFIKPFGVDFDRVANAIQVYE
jgi:hypothetical protein